MSTIVKSVSFKADGVPQAGLSCTATARNLNTGADLASSIAVADVGNGIYSVTYTYTTAVPCRAIINAGTDAIDTRYIDVEFTIAELNASASLPSVIAPGANGGLPTTNGTKLSQTADLTSGQSIACSDKTGFSLSATGLDLVTAASTFGVAMIAGIWAAATSGMATVGSIGKKLADWVVGTIDTYTGNTKQTGDAYATLTAMKGTDNKILVSTDAQDLSGTLSVNAKKLSGQTPPLGSDNKMQITTDAMTEAYAADGAAPSIQQALFAIQQFLQESSVLSTTLTVKKLNGSTVAMTFSLDSATTPTSITRAS